MRAPPSLLPSSLILLCLWAVQIVVVFHSLLLLINPAWYLGEKREKKEKDN
jgi:hypothetical protein